MTRIREPRVQAGVDDTAPRVMESLFGELYSLRQNILVRSMPGTFSEQLSKIVGAHACDAGKLRQAQIVSQVLPDIIEHAFQPISRHAPTIGNRHIAARRI